MTVSMIRASVNTLMDGEWPMYLHEGGAMVFNGQSWISAQEHDGKAISSVEIPFSGPEEVERVLLGAFALTKAWTFVIHISMERETVGIWTDKPEALHRHFGSQRWSKKTFVGLQGTIEHVAEGAYQIALAAYVIRS